jgi:hypothetical protein
LVSSLLFSLFCVFFKLIHKSFLSTTGSRHPLPFRPIRWYATNYTYVPFINICCLFFFLLLLLLPLLLLLFLLLLLLLINTITIFN